MICSVNCNLQLINNSNEDDETETIIYFLATKSILSHFIIFSAGPQNKL